MLACDYQGLFYDKGIKTLCENSPPCGIRGKIHSHADEQHSAQTSLQQDVNYKLHT